jgi:murein DD-endopeptidase MepM/ murein hydrolase activator NlpD
MRLNAAFPGHRALASALCCAALAALCLTSAAAERAPWRARRRPDAPLPNKLADARVTLAEWGAEPAQPAEVDVARFAAALAKLCALPSPKRAQPMAEAALAAGKQFDVDPFLLGALAFAGSYCRASYADALGAGLTSLPLAMYQGDFKRGRYRYRVEERGAWQDREQDLSRFPFGAGQLVRAEPNMYFTAGLLASWRAQHDCVDHWFEQVPHRHFVSHWIWGDRVKSARDEDRVLIHRRRLLEYYGALPPRPPLHYRGVALGSPLDGAPRVVSSGLGFVRDDGERSHRGIDIEAEFGEPVRAIADGLVVFSGVDLPGRQAHAQLAIAATNAYSPSQLGHGGRYVCIQHASSEGPALRSCYMHLQAVAVAYGDKVQRGSAIGIVGRSGMKSSAPHLHLELFALDQLLDPLPILHGHVIGTPIDFAAPPRRRRR